MDLLLDTHVWMWAFENPTKLGGRTRGLLLSTDNRRFVSSISTLELSRLVSLDQVPMTETLSTWMEESQRDLLLTFLDLDHASAREAYELPGTFHADPADRMLAATARCHDLMLLTADERILGYPHVRHMDART